jgi:hypothetical protein
MRIATRLMAGVAPVISNLMVKGGIDTARKVIADDEWLARNGLRRIEPEPCGIDGCDCHLHA